VDYEVFLVSQIEEHVHAVRVYFGRRPMIEIAMSRTLAIILKPVFAGWAVCLSDGRELARFRGPGARCRADWYLANVTRV